MEKFSDIATSEPGTTQGELPGKPVDLQARAKVNRQRRAVTGGALLLTVVGLTYSASRTTQAKEVWSQERRGLTSHIEANDTNQPSQANKGCKITDAQPMSQAYARNYIAAQLNFNNNSRLAFGMNVSCEPPLDTAVLQNGIHIDQVGEQGQMMFSHCVLLPADVRSDSATVTHNAQAYCAREIDFA
jgi:hypothetical protein